MTIPARTGLLATLRRAVAALDQGFCKLNRIQFAAPWRNETASRC